MKVDVDGGKYTVVIPNTGSVTALRHGEPWRDCCGDNLIFHLAWELHEARERIKELELA